MDKLNMQTKNLADENFKKLAELFPNAVTETIDQNGELVRAIDKDVLMQEISTKVVEGKEERYQFTWPDKRKTILAANAPTTNTLRPCKEESVNFDTTQNLYIEGDNLEVLKLLRETYLGKVKMIYIDPPYNTGNDFVYADDFAESTDEYLANSGQYDTDGNRLFTNNETNGRFHTDWLNMIYSRLKMAKDLLADDGVIFISIDNNEFQNISKVSTEIFGEKNFISTLCVENNPKGRKNNAFIAESHEYCLIYARKKSYIYSILSKQKQKKFFMGLKETTNASRKVLQDEYGSFYQSKRQVSGINKSNPLASKSNRERCFTIYYTNKPKEDITLLDEYDAKNDAWVISEEGKRLLNNGWQRYYCLNNITMKPAIPLYSKNTIIQRFRDHLLYFKTDGTIYEKERDDEQQITSVLNNKKYGLDIMTESATSKMEDMFGVKGIFENSKAVDFIKAMVNLYPLQDLTVLDFFSGSATTAHAVMQLNAEDGGNRKFIMVQLPEKCEESSEAFKAGYKNICEIGKERIRRAGRKILEEHPLLSDLDIGFRVLKVDSSNMSDVYYKPHQVEHQGVLDLKDNIKDGRNEWDLLFQVMLAFGIELSAKIEARDVCGARVFYVNDYLAACFEKKVSEEVLTAIAKSKPHYAVFRDGSFASDMAEINCGQIFKFYSPDTVIKVL